MSTNRTLDIPLYLRGSAAQAQNPNLLLEAALRVARMEAALRRVRALIPTANPELLEAGYGIDSRDLLDALELVSPAVKVSRHDPRCERFAFHDPNATPCTWRERACVANWSVCASGNFNPACCRFPKSCSVDDVEIR